jgi:hypothetical protein
MWYAGWYLGVVVFLWVAQCSIPAQGAGNSKLSKTCVEDGNGNAVGIIPEERFNYAEEDMRP